MIQPGRPAPSVRPSRTWNAIDAVSAPATHPPTCLVLLSDTLDLGFLRPALQKRCPGVDIRTVDRLGDPADIEVAICWNPPAGALARLPSLRLVQSIGAGVDHILRDPALPRAVPVCRVMDPGIAASISAYVAWAVIHQQRHFDRYLASRARRRWQEEPIVPPSRHRVGVAGLGWLGSACAAALAAAGYNVRGWRRAPGRPAPVGIAVFHGADQLDEFLAGCDTLVCVLPLTRETEGFMDADRLARLPRGAHVVNVGRGAHIVAADLLAAIASGHVAAATLDAFTDEPLPADHPFWAEPRITITPHIAGRTDLDVIAAQTLENLAVVRAGGRPAASVDPYRGY